METHLYITLVFLILIYNVISENPPKLTISQGTLQGYVRYTLKGRPILAFQSIPYAEPPIGEKRFKAPIPLHSWDGVLDATKNHNFCPQNDVMFRLYGVHGDEDCLFLNVYTPKISDELLPVIVFIHGGGFTLDSANPSLYGPNILLDKDVVLVTVNYRLGALGFLSTEDDVVPGNNGLKDQSLALLWVKHNIKEFGGNSRKITIFGQSAGGASVYYHLLSPLSRDLVFAGISSSGILAPWALALKGEAKHNARLLAKHLNCPTTSSTELVECLRTIKALDIVKQSEKFMVFGYDPCIPFKPVVEYWNKDGFLPQHPIEIIEQGKMANVPFMTGITTDDGAMKSAAIYNQSDLVQRLNSDFNQYLPMLLNYDNLYVNESADKFSEAIKDFYLKDKDLYNSPKSVLTDMVTDSLFFYPARLTSTLHAKYSKKPVYFYLFGYRGSTSTSTYFGDPEHNYGVAHCDDLIYVISSEIVVFNPNEEDKKMIDVMTSLWFNFATTGNPTPDSEVLIPTHWNPVITDDLEYYFIQKFNEIEMKKQLFEERFQFWKKLNVFKPTQNIKDEL
ncbi:hypothetical protein FQR65_LT06595 [Abscondita terminalis]|nr:hypothetical protein FQR65_LT06595 [Abscondita terminalis]